MHADLDTQGPKMAGIFFCKKQAQKLVQVDALDMSM